MQFFSSRSKTRSPVEVVRTFRENGVKLERVDPGAGGAEARKKYTEEINKALAAMKSILSGEGGTSLHLDSLHQESTPETITQLANELYAQNALELMVTILAKLDFEGKKDVCQIFSLALRRKIGDRFPTAEHIKRNPGIMFGVLRGYGDDDIALNCGMILKEMLRYESLARILLESDEFYTFPDYIEKSSFGTSCDAFANMKETLTRHKPMVAAYLEENYDRFFTAYQTLILSENYVTKRQSLKLLGEILLDRANFNIMTRYIASKDNLQVIMNMLRDRSKNIQFEAFHVFKVFVANPNKPPAIASVLARNRDRLLTFLRDFHRDRDDEQFNDEKAYLISQIEAL